MLPTTTIIDVSQAGLPQIPGLILSAATVASSLDQTPQPLLIGVPEALDPGVPTPLLVGLHTWSADYLQMVGQFAPLCAQYGWLMVLPHFRGPNLDTNPDAVQAGASLAAQRDVVDAVHHLQRHYAVDDTRLYLLGGSGGGHMALMMAGKYPDLWAGVSAWCPVTDLRDWYEQGNAYAPHLAAVCGGIPDASAAVDFEYLRRSPRTFLANAANTNLQIAHGDKDPVIWVTQTWQTYEVLRPWPHRAEFASWSGGHDLLPDRGFQWLAQQVKPLGPPLRQTVVSDEGKWYYWLYLQPAAPLTLARCEAAWTGLPKLPDAPPPTLTLQVEHSAVTRLRLSDLGLGQPSGVTRQARPCTDYHLDGGLLELPPAAERTEYVFTF